MRFTKTSLAQIAGQSLCPLRIDRRVHAREQPAGFNQLCAHHGNRWFFGERRTWEDDKLFAIRT